MNKTVFMAALAASLAVPVAVAPLVQAAETQPTFTDVPKTHPSFAIIHEMRDTGIINGYPDGTFQPAKEIKRSHVAELLARALPLEPVREAKEFSDVPVTHPYYEAIQKVQRAGIIDGSDGKFNPDKPLTRVQMAKILTLAFDLKVKADYDFPDVATTHWGNEYVRALYSNGITTGSNGYYKPNDAVTRAHYATFLHRLLNIDPDFVPKPIPKPEVKPEPKPEPQPEPIPQPNEPKPGEVGYEPDDWKQDPVRNVSTIPGIPNRQEIQTPAGWTADKMKEYEELAVEEVYKKSPINNHGRGTINIHDKRSLGMSEKLKAMLSGLNARGVNLTYEEYVALITKTIESGEFYIHPDHRFGMYYDYQRKVIVEFV
ncbi:S-layer homology domain-containing protein [Lysinibacillus sp. BF-4]|uniref:S-layer homology domain-containing protein n=1 Tax=Lysinibacillus sp. BF-4 TaxID=1473546 RepID=UPI00068C4E68|nr:S-layer homology domain-containing protein [Lysinibacillus sp. BF-4]